MSSQLVEHVKIKNQRLLTSANIAMVVTLLLFLTAVVLAYGFDEYFGLYTLVLFHITQLVFAGLFKLSYVVRLVAQKQLGYAIR